MIDAEDMSDESGLVEDEEVEVVDAGKEDDGLFKTTGLEDFEDEDMAVTVAPTVAAVAPDTSSLSTAQTPSTNTKNRGGSPKGSKNKAKPKAPETTDVLQAFILSEKLAGKREKARQKARDRRDKRQFKMMFGMLATAITAFGGNALRPSGLVNF